MTIRNVNLDGKWKLGWQNCRRTADYQQRPRKGLINVNVPGDIHLALMEAGKIDDPVKNDNNRKLGWVGNKEWWFYRDFELSKYDGKIVEIDFKGLDYEAEVWINGRHAASHSNMFRPLRIDLTGLVKDKNRIAVRLLPLRSDLDRLPAGSQMRMTGRPYIDMPEEVRTSRPWMRKAQYTFGWDWTQALYTCGLWRGVELQIIDKLAIEEEFVFTHSADTKSAELSFRCKSRSFLKLTADATLTVDIFRKGKGGAKAATFKKEVLLAPGSTEHEIKATLPDPALWWPLGYGEQSLYEARFSLRAEGGETASGAATFGIRTIEFDESPREKKGAYRFRLVVNGTPVFLKGCNWVPANIIPGRVTASDLRRLLELARDGNQNYLRVWGGGYYEDPEFYRLCDEFGIVVWQDFMFACAEYPDFDEKFMEEIRREIPWAIKELRNHPSIVVWCGNNEIDQQCNLDGYRSTRPNQQYYGQPIFYELIPEILKKLDPSRPYFPSSGCLGKHDGDSKDFMNPYSGATHIALGQVCAKGWEKKIPSFLNELYCGVAPLDKKTLPLHLDKKHLKWNDPVWEQHNFIFRGGQNDFVKAYHDKFVNTDKLSFLEQYYYWQMVQAETIKDKVELLRAYMWENSGYCFWMYNDAFPAATHSIVDYYHREKPSYFHMKNASAPILPIARHVEGNLEITIANDTLQDLTGQMTTEVISFAGKVLIKSSKQVKAKANCSTQTMIINQKALAKIDPASVVVWMEFKQGSKILGRNRFFIEPFKALKIPDAQVKIQPKLKGNKVISIKISCPTFARNFNISSTGVDLNLADNYFDICPGKVRTLAIKPAVPFKELVFEWENQATPLHSMLKLPIDGVTSVAGSKPVLAAEVFNPGSTTRKYSLSATAPQPWGGDAFSANLELAGGESALVPVPIAIPLSAAQSGSESVEVMLSSSGKHHANTVNIIPVNPLTLKIAQSGGGVRVTVKNHSQTPVKGAKISVTWEDLKRGACAKIFPAAVIPAGKSISQDIKLPASVMPYSCKAILEAAELPPMSTSCWLKAGKKNYCSALSTKPIDSSSMTAIRIKDGTLPNLAKSTGYLLDPRSADLNLFSLGNQQGPVVMFLHYSRKQLFMDVFISGDDCKLPEPEISLHRGSCIEFGFSTSNNKLGFEAAMGINKSGPNLWLRRSLGAPVGAFLDTPHLSILRQPGGGLTYYSVALDWDLITKNYTPQKGKEISGSFVLKTNVDKGIRLFGGIQAAKDITRYGSIKLG